MANTDQNPDFSNIQNVVGAAVPHMDTFVSNRHGERNYLKILYKPGIAVQVRELNEMQTQVQDQFDKFGAQIFKRNSRIIGTNAQVQTDVDAIEIKITDGTTEAGLTNNDVVDTLLGRKLANSAGTEAVVIGYKLKGQASDGNNIYIVFLRYGKKNVAGSNYVNTVFGLAETISRGGTTIGTTQSTSGFGTIATIDKGVYFTNGFFVVCEPQKLLIYQGASSASYNGDFVLRVSESKINVAVDSTLRDNALNSNDNRDQAPNYGAPGADRYSISLDFKLQTDNGPLNQNNNDGVIIPPVTTINPATQLGFIPLVTMINGRVAKYEQAGNYSQLGHRLADRTFDESGDYVVDPFPIKVSAGATGKYKVKIGASTAYIGGQRVKTLVSQEAEVDYTGESETTGMGGVSVPLTQGNYIEVDEISGDLTGFTSNTFELYSHRELYSNSPAGNSIGTINISHIERTQSSFATGVGNTRFKLYVSAYTINAGYALKDVAYIADSADATKLQARLARRHGGTGPAFSEGFVLKDTHLNKKVFNVGRVSTSDVTNPKYVTQAQVTSTASSGSVTSVTFNKPSGGSYYSLNPMDYVLMVNNIHVPVTSVSISTAVTLNFSGSITLTAAARCLAPTFRTLNAISKGTLASNSVSSTTTLNYGTKITLTNSDVHEITSVQVGGSDLNVDDFLLDSGQTDQAYGTGSVTYLGPNISGSATYTVSYKYYNPSNPGGTDNAFFFSSYSAANAGWYKNMFLSDLVDFRPSSTVTNIATFYPNKPFVCDLKSSHARVDLVTLSDKGILEVIKGQSNPIPEPPTTPAGSIALYEITLPAGIKSYTVPENSLQINFVQNQRYTMKEIGDLEQRVKKLEYYTSLSLLESDANSKQIFDSGGVRFKTGMFVDPFIDHSNGQLFDPEYRCSINPATGELRPTFKIQSFHTFLPDNKHTYSDIETNRVEPVLRLEGTQKNLIFQEYASELMNINPYEVAKFVGNIKLSPSSDHWKSYDRKPDRILTDHDGHSALLEQAAAINTEPPLYGDWAIDWQPTDRTFRRTSEPHSVVDPSDGKLKKASWTYREETGSGRRDIFKKSASIKVKSHTEADRILDISVIPFMRSRVIFFKAQGLRPNIQVVPYFDDVQVNDWCKKVNKATFDLYRYDKGDNDILLEPIMSGAHHNKDAYTASTAHTAVQTQLSSIALLDSGTLTTDDNGELYGYFILPNTSGTLADGSEEFRFETGTKKFRLIDNFTNPQDPSATAFATANYTATGQFVTVQKEVSTVYELEVATERTQEVNDTFSRDRLIDTKYTDPLAQTFTIGDFEEYSQGIFASSIEVYFGTKPNPVIDSDGSVADDQPSKGLPVTAQLVTCRDGTPTQNIVPGTRITLNPDQVTTSTNGADGESTKFNFDYPVHLRYGQEYAIVLLSNSVDYRVWVSNTGDEDKSGKGKIQKNPYAGVLLSSQNASSWTPHQTKDLKFKLNYLEFPTNTAATATSHNFTTQLPKGGQGTQINDFKLCSAHLSFTDLIINETDVIYDLTVQNAGSGTSTFTNLKSGQDINVANAVTMNAGSQAVMSAALVTGNKYLTPVINLERTAINAVENNITSLGTTALGYETTPGNGGTQGNIVGRYISKKVKLNNAASRLDVFLGVNKKGKISGATTSQDGTTTPVTTDVRVFAKINNSTNQDSNGEATSFFELTHPEVSATGGTDQFQEEQYTIDFQSVLNDSPAAASISAMDETFDEFEIKIILMSTDPAVIPTVTDLRALATA
jgi:hypothetical protein